MLKHLFDSCSTRDSALEYPSKVVNLDLLLRRISSTPDKNADSVLQVVQDRVTPLPQTGNAATTRQNS